MSIGSEGGHFIYDGDYRPLLRQIHEHLRPRTYLEIGVFQGRSITLVAPETHAVGVDPVPRIARPLTTRTDIYDETSDTFFEHHADEAFFGEPIDLVFIDGVHLFEYALRDFLNAERLCTNRSVILFHDCLPPDATTAMRETSTQAADWAGDVWKLLFCLAEHRPDVTVHVVNVGPTGLGVVTGLDPNNDALRATDELVAKYLPLTYDDLLARASEISIVPNQWRIVASLLPAPYQPPDPSADSTKRWPRTFRAQRRRAHVWLSESRAARLLRRMLRP